MQGTLQKEHKDEVDLFKVSALQASREAAARLEAAEQAASDLQIAVQARNKDVSSLQWDLKVARDEAARLVSLQEALDACMSEKARMQESLTAAQVLHMDDSATWTTRHYVEVLCLSLRFRQRNAPQSGKGSASPSTFQ